MAIRSALEWFGSTEGYEHWFNVWDRSITGQFPYEFSDEMKEGEK
jgi:hypothetical protein